MKVRVRQKMDDWEVDEVYTGRDEEAIVTAMKGAVAGRLNFALRLMVNAMSPLAFAQEVVQRYNEAEGKALPRPASCEQFLQLGEAEGIVTFLER